MTDLAEIFVGADLAWKDKVACEVQASLWSTDAPKVILERRVAELARSWNVESMLDIGCGCGRYYSAIRPNDYLGIDQSEAFIDIARREYADATFMLSRIEKANVHTPFDLGIIIHVLQHVHQPIDFLKYTMQQFNCKRWCFTVLTVPGDVRKVFNIGEYEAALALPQAEVVGELNALDCIEGWELQQSVGVVEARELLAWTRESDGCKCGDRKNTGSHDEQVGFVI